MIYSPAFHVFHLSLCPANPPLNAAQMFDAQR